MSGLMVLAMAAAGVTTPTSARFECGQTVVAARFTDARATVRIGDRSYRLGQVVVADGARYAGFHGKQRIEFWAKGRGATLTIGKRAYPACELAELPVGKAR